MRRLKENAPALVAIVRCRTAACASAAFRKIENPGEPALATYYSQLFALDPHDRTAALGLLQSLPKNLAESTGVDSTDEYLYKKETAADLKLVARVGWELSRRAAAALHFWPGLLPAYLSYGEIAFLDSEDEYPNLAEKICRENPKHFLQALRALSAPDQCYFANRIVNPRGCRQIAVTEAE
ncbi:MAG: hypothetical protein ACRD13_04885 [Terriglobales bacterium]